MKIENIDFFYLSMPQIQDVADGSQDALLVRVQAGGYTGWGECEASPLVSIASWICPMSHRACKPVQASVLGQSLRDVRDIARIHAQVRANSLDLLQCDHTLSGVDIALWDLLGQRLQVPVYQLLGYRQAYPKTAYASQLFGDDPAATYRKAQQVRAAGFRAAKFGWGPYGWHTVEQDAEQVHAARDGLGQDGILLIDAGTIWDEDVAAAQARLPALHEAKVTWLEEPFVTGALEAYRELKQATQAIGVAAGEGCHNVHQARHLMDFGQVDYIQIDAGRIGGITAAKRVAELAEARGVRFVNHTFTTQLALSASLQAYAGQRDNVLCEFPVAASSLARELSPDQVPRDEAGQLQLPERPGLGIVPSAESLRPYLVDVEIRVGPQTLYRTPAL